MSEFKLQKCMTLKNKSTITDDIDNIKMIKIEKKRTLSNLQEKVSPYNLEFSMLNPITQNSTELLMSPKKKIMRKDFKGNIISKGYGKKQHITFRDYTGRISLVDYVNIQSFKIPSEEKKEKEDTSCACSIF
jgi:hypothetical protein